MTARTPAQAALRLTMAGLITASMAYALMQTFLIPALPVLQRELHTSTGWVTWTVTAYLLSGAVATPIVSRLGDQHGKKRMMMISLGIFLARLHRRARRAQRRRPDRVPRRAGRRRRRVPVELRHHP